MTVRSAAARRTNGRVHTNGHARPKLPPADSAVIPVISVRLDRIRPSVLNPRKHFDEAKLAELAESIKTVGLLEPIIVRKAPGFQLSPGVAKSSGKWCWESLSERIHFSWFDSRKEAELAPPLELVAGERRFRACQLAGLTHIDAKVQELTDKQVVEIAVVENEQRDDTRASEKARGYGDLIDKHGYTVETLAARIGKSETTIRDLLRLRNLPEEATAALDAGELSPSVAQLLARLPTPELRQAGERFALDQDYAGNLPSFRDFRGWVQRECLIELKGCPFRQDDASLTEAPSCRLCPKRVGNLQKEEPGAWEGARADVCTDPACYRAKVAAHGERLKTQAEADGLKVLPALQSAKVFPYSTALAYDAPYFDLASSNHYDSKGRTYEELLGKDLKDLAGDIVLAFDRQGNPHRLIPKAKAGPILEKKFPRQPGLNGRAPTRSREDKAREERAKAGKAASIAANVAVADAMQAAAGDVEKWPGALVLKLRALAMVLPDIVWSDASRCIVQRRGLPKGDDREAVRAEANNLDTAPQLLALIAELVSAKLSYDWGGLYSSGHLSSNESAFWEAWGVHPAKLRKDAEKEQKAKKAGRKGIKAHEPEGGEE